ncbi:MAG: hypothetical protein HY046_02085 [Acidobacteria bacterium]|nr:hypothetical protein [Acidobacteriota bacterium]
MCKKLLVRNVLFAAALLLMTSGVLGAKPVSKNINLTEAAKIGHSQVDAGDYILLIEGNKVTVKKYGKIVAETTGQWEERAEKSKFNAVVTGAERQLQEIRFAGKKQVLVLQAE